MEIIYADEPVAQVTEQPALDIVASTGGYGANEHTTPRGSTGLSRKLPWGVGRVLGEQQGAKQYGSVREAMVQEGLNWQVVKTPVLTHHEGRVIPNDEFQAVKRDDTGHVLGIVKGRYELYQWDRLAAFSDTLVEMKNDRTAAVGESFGGKKVWSVVQMPDVPTPDGGLGAFLITQNSHDGSSSLSSSFMIVRWSCTNGLVSLSELPYTVKIRHTSTMEMRAQEAHRVMAQANEYLVDTQATVEQMLATPVMPHTADLWVREHVVPVPDTDNKRAINNAEKRQDEILSTLKHSPNLADVRNTGWGFFNAVAEWDEWEGSHVNRRRLTPMERLLNDTQRGAVERARDLALVG